jgi:hypothetical protein
MTPGEQLDQYPLEPSYFRNLTGTDLKDLKIGPEHGGPAAMLFGGKK